MRPRFTFVLLLTLVAGGALLAACGDGSTPAPVASTIYPSPGGSPGTTLAPSPPSSPGPTGDSPSPGATGTGGTTGGGTGGTGGGGQPAVSDTTIRANILRRLAQSPALTGLLFKVRVKDRVVYLSGIVKTDAQKQDAEQIARTEPGIKKVISYVFVEPEGNGGY